MKTLSFLLFGLVAGFLLHALVFPDFLANGIIFIPQKTVAQPTAPQTELEPLITTITYNGVEFSRTNVTIEISRYIVIINESQDQLMWLLSDEPLLTTLRGYGYKEQVKARLERTGQYIVYDKANPKIRMVITVKN